MLYKGVKTHNPGSEDSQPFIYNMYREIQFNEIEAFKYILEYSIYQICNRCKSQSGIKKMLQIKDYY